MLASASTSRLRLLRKAGLDPIVIVSEVDEEAALEQAHTDAGSVARFQPSVIADLLAKAKARDVAAMLKRTDDLHSAIVIGGDSVLEWGGRDWGKPGTAEAATLRWKEMRGSTGQLHTGHCVIDLASGRELAEVATADVTFADISDEEVDAYVASGEPLQVAGAFTIEGLAGPFIESINGDPSNVTGISLPLLRRQFRELGIVWTDLWKSPR